MYGVAIGVARTFALVVDHATTLNMLFTITYYLEIHIVVCHNYPHHNRQ